MWWQLRSQPRSPEASKATKMQVEGNVIKNNNNSCNSNPKMSISQVVYNVSQLFTSIDVKSSDCDELSQCLSWLQIILSEIGNMVSITQQLKAETTISWWGVIVGWYARVCGLPWHTLNIILIVRFIIQHLIWQQLVRCWFRSWGETTASGDLCWYHGGGY